MQFEGSACPFWLWHDWVKGVLQSILFRPDDLGIPTAYFPSLFCLFWSVSSMENPWKEARDVWCLPCILFRPDDLGIPTAYFPSLFCLFWFVSSMENPWKEARDVWCLPFLFAESQGCHLIPLSCLPVVILPSPLSLSCHFSANGPFSWLSSRKLSSKQVSLRVRLLLSS